ncbi:AraC family transcriptional regulator [Paenibacillus eucommiae]|uniref:AraC-like DNA-binding protein n=1 Tax=Paenibacillus eucommiae TaxID=1355755 RepID=A0ABS4IVV4_9BACL|nr:helix-turn-helix domain-containing protein [Paenibacillus eucommiae]MBP1990971.1 AraC-like DNA-binding protein [Paenibacillus eucommiae]
MPEYKKVHLKPTIVINKIVTMYYLEFSKCFEFLGEDHDFWELFYVDKGEIEMTADGIHYSLKQGSLIFHKPNEFHRFHAIQDKAINLIVITFESSSKAMRHFHNYVTYLQDGERNLLADIIKEGTNAFNFPFQLHLQRKDDQQTGSEQMIKNYLEIFLIRLLRKMTTNPPSEIDTSLSSPAKERSDDDMTNAIIQFLKFRLYTHVHISEISNTLHVSKSRLMDIFKKKTGKGIMEYFSYMKIEQAKLSIREDVRNFTEISSMLGFSSVHYFSKTFKRLTGMSPSEYAKSVMARR